MNLDETIREKALNRFSEEEVAKFERTGVDLDYFLSFSENFDFPDIADLLLGECKPEVANMYDKFLRKKNIVFRGYQIAILNDFKILPDIFPLEETQFNVLKAVIDFYQHENNTIRNISVLEDGFAKEIKEHGGGNTYYREQYKWKKPKRYRRMLLGSGSSSIIMMDSGKHAMKFYLGDQMSREMKMLQYGHRIKNKKWDYVIHYINYWASFGHDNPFGYFVMPIIKGSTLQEKIEKNELTNDKIIKYSYHIIKGLLELREAGIWYHRDIRPANIMIDEEKDSAIIIDLGIATTDKNAPIKDNRRYGSSGAHPNDLISLGQVMYKMATGENLFAKSKSKSMGMTIYAERVRDERDHVYADKTGRLLQPYLQKVDENISDPILNDLIKSCLISRRGQYKRMLKKFKIYCI